MKNIPIAILAAGVIAAVPFTSSASSIRVNSSCEVGSCTSSDVLAYGTSASTPFDFEYTFANSDHYQVQGDLNVSNTSTGFSLAVSDLLLTYLGNATSTASATDVLTTDFLQNVAFARGYTTTAYEYVDGVFGPGLGSASSASGQAFFAGASLPLMGPYTSPGDFHGYKTGAVYVPAGTPLVDYRYTLTFGEGSTAGSTISVNPLPVAATPELGTLSMVGTGVLSFAGFLRRRRA